MLDTQNKSYNLLVVHQEKKRKKEKKEKKTSRATLSLT